MIMSSVVFRPAADFVPDEVKNKHATQVYSTALYFHVLANADKNSGVA